MVYGWHLDGVQTVYGWCMDGVAHEGEPRVLTLISEERYRLAQAVA